MIEARRSLRRGRGTPVVLVAWIAVLGGTVALGIAGREANPRTGAASPIPSNAPSVTRGGPHPPLPTRPPIGEDGIMGGLPFGTAWQWLESD